MQHTINDALRETTKRYLDSLDRDNIPEPAVIEYELLDEIYRIFQVENTVNLTGEKWKAPKTLAFWQIAMIISALYHVCKIPMAEAAGDSEYDLLAIYHEDGDKKGIYTTDEETFKKIAKQYNRSLKASEMKELLDDLKLWAPRKIRCQEKNLIAVNNGIFDFDTKQLLDFSPEYVFTTKTPVDYNPNAMNINIHNDSDGTDWNIEDWMFELSDDPSIVGLLWKTLGAIVRPNVPWNKSVWFYSESGNNGKGTLCELMRQLCGEGSYAAIPLSDMGKEFALEPLVRSSAIIVDENDVGTFIDKAANLKALITGDVVQINRKFKTPIPFKFHGLMVQCLNEMPRIKDKSDSFFRRQIFVPFEKCFTGKERKYIKHDYLHRKDVLEYVLYKVMNMDYYELSEPESCKKALKEYKEYNDPVRQFIVDIVPDLQWDLVPSAFLYDLYCAWYRRNMGSGMPQGRKTFIKDFNFVIDSEYPGWEVKKDPIRTGDKMSKPEPFIEMFDLKAWKGGGSSTDTMEQKCTPSGLCDKYRGIVRRSADIE